MGTRPTSACVGKDQFIQHGFGTTNRKAGGFKRYYPDLRVHAGTSRRIVPDPYRRHLRAAAARASSSTSTAACPRSSARSSRPLTGRSSMLAPAHEVPPPLCVLLRLAVHELPGHRPQDRVLRASEAHQMEQMDKLGVNVTPPGSLPVTPTPSVVVCTARRPTLHRGWLRGRLPQPGRRPDSWSDLKGRGGGLWTGLRPHVTRFRLFAARSADAHRTGKAPDARETWQGCRPSRTPGRTQRHNCSCHRHRPLNPLSQSTSANKKLGAIACFFRHWMGLIGTIVVARPPASLTPTSPSSVYPRPFGRMSVGLLGPFYPHLHRVKRRTKTDYFLPLREVIV